MAHVHGDKSKVTQAAKMAGMGMMENMKMMGPGPHGPMMGEMMHGAGNAAGHIAKGAAVTVTVKKGGTLMTRLARHPLLVFGLGVAAGIVVYKYRKQIISTAMRAGEKSKDFVLQQKETLEDIVAETKEEGEK